MEDETFEAYPVEDMPGSTAETGEADGEQSPAKQTRFVKDLLETLILSVLLFVGINSISARIRVDGFSMEPTLQSGEFVIVNKLAYQLGEPRYGDVIVFQYPRDPDQEYIKRVIGLPGDSVRITNGSVIVNGETIDEPYIAAQPNYNSVWEVPQESIFVLGDNRNRSSDSHNWGPVPLDNIIGKALLIYWPPEQWGIVPHFSTASATQDSYPEP
jgi:signal peptidase I